MAEETMSSNRRIQLLRERLELYNATIAEALGVRDTEKANMISSNRTAPVRFGKKAATNGNSGPEPRLERDLCAEFNAAHATTATTTATNTTTTSTTAVAADSAELRRCEKKNVVPPPPSSSPSHSLPPSPPLSPANSGRWRGQLNSVSSLFCGDSSTAYTSGGDDEDDDGDAAFVNPFLNEVVHEEDIDASLHSDSDRSAARSDAKNAGQRGFGRRGGDRDRTGAVALPSPPAPQQKNAAGEEAKAKAQEVQAERALEFAMLESAYYKLSVAKQAISKLQQILDIDRFPRLLPQRQNSQRIAEIRDELIKKEQALRCKETGSSSLSAIYHPAALGIEQQVRHMLAECDSAKAFFSRVRERKVTVEEKERLLKKKLNELDELQRELREKQQTLVTLERRNGQREATLLAREEKYRKDMEAHSERERSLQKKINEVEELSCKVSSWMKILDDRDTKMAAKEQRLRCVQADLVRRSEELLCYRSGRAKQSAQNPESRSAKNL